MRTWGMSTIKQTEVAMKVTTFRNAGLEAKWGKTSIGQPCMFVRKRSGATWWMVTKQMADSMRENGIVTGFENATLLGDIFSIRA